MGTALVGACAEKKGALMLAINTDMRAPKDVNAVSVTISTNGAIKHSFIGRVTPQGEVLLPATLAIAEPDDASASVRIRVMAFQERKPRVLRDVRTTVPGNGRTALLRIPLNFVNDGSTKSAPLPDGILPIPSGGTTSGGTASGGTASGGATSGGTVDAGTSSGGTTSGGASSSGDLPAAAGEFDFLSSFQPDCPDFDNQTWIDGECKDNYVDSSTLPDFDDSQLGSSIDVGSCFDLTKCFANATPIGDVSSTGADGGADGTGVPAADASTPTQRDAGAPGTDAGADAGAGFKDFRLSAITLDRTTCTIQLNGADPARLNLAIVTPDTGECIRPNECYIPIDRGASGWQDANGRIQLPTYVCRLLNSKGLRLATSTDTCAAKEEKNPICTPAASDQPLADGGTVGPGASPLVAEIAYPTTVATTSGAILYFAGETGVSMVDLTKPGSPATAAGKGIMSGHKPWRFGNALSGVTVADGTQNAYYLFNGTLDATSMLVSPGTNSGTSVNAGYAWAVGGPGAVNPGIYLSAGAGMPGELLPLMQATQPVTLDPTAIIGTGGDTVVVGESNGTIRACFISMAQCGVPTPVGEGRVDAFVNKPNVANAGYALLPNGVYRSTVVDTQTGAIQSALVQQANLGGVNDTATMQYYPRGLAVNPQCVFFSGVDGLWWANDGGGALFVPAAGRQILGVAIGPDPTGQFGPAGALYYSVYAPIKSGDPAGGGIYRVGLPAQCGGSSGSGSGGTTTDAGGPGQCGPANCPGCCDNKNVCTPFGMQTNASCGFSGNKCLPCAADGGPATCGPAGLGGGSCQ